MLASWITLAHFAVSATMRFSKSLGDIGIGTTKIRKACLDLRVSESGVYFLVQPIDDFAGCILGRADALPSAGLEAWHRLCDGWDLGQRPGACRSGHGQRAHLAGFCTRFPSGMISRVS